MIVLSANNLTKTYGTDVIIDKASFHLNAGDKVGIIGRNGAGKTTLLNMLTGELPCDGGEFFVSQNTRIGYLKQRDNFNSEGTVLEEIEGIFSGLRELENEIAELSDKVAENPQDTGLLNRLDELQHRFDREGGYTYKSEMIGILNSMAFDESFYNKKISSLSGGERTRLALAALLLEKPDILLLDEPTNHLDIGTLKWLEQYLEAYRGTIMIVSHDRYFLDRTVNRIFEVENHKVYSYQGKYSDYAAQKKLRRETELRAYNNQQREIARQEEMIRRMKQRGTEHLAKRAASREKRLDMIERIERPESEMGKMKIHFKENFPSGGDVIMAENLEKSFGRGSERRDLFHGVNLDIKRGERICILGPNGVGKTTLLRVLLGELTPDAGYLKIGHNVAFGYYDQGQLLLSDANTVLEELKESYRLYTDTEMRSILGRFLFKGEEVFLPVGSLSGGEKARLSLLKLMLSGANTLILDEPTNHLDIESKEVFEEALMEFPGTVIVVSHDRYFLQRIPTRILELTQDGVIEYLGRYDYYLEKKSQGISSKKYFSKTQEKPAGDAAEQRRLKKEREAEERRRARLSEKLETEISELEDKISELEHNLCKPENMSDYELLARLGAERQEAEKRLAEAYDEWAKVQEA
ncbi:MAG: ABC-F family ATP-binding cassette domain-containing protein [Firmicutes bacterium]|nr:ABC-F family ATP-binding cassette domain-containing protein [Bacillota bacterium]